MGGGFGHRALISHNRFSNMQPTSTPSRLQRIGVWLVRPWVAWVLCVVAGFLIYAPALHGDLIWDDQYLVGENPFFRSPVFGVEVFRHYLFFDSFSTYYRPVQNWSYMLDYWIWRGEPAGYHLTNILLHSLSGVFLFELLRRLLPALLDRDRGEATLRTDLVALLVALIWVVHPIHNAAVAYISGRADSLASFFALLAWLLVLRMRKSHSPIGRGMLAVSAAAFVLVALCSKEIALLWLALFAVEVLLFEKQWSWRAKGFAVAGALAVLGIYAGLHALPAYRAPMEDGPPLPFDGRFLLMLRALGDYAGLIVYPGTLHMERSLSDPAIYSSVAAWRGNTRYEYLTILGLLAALAGIWLCRLRGPGRHLRWFGALWFAIAFLPISNLFPLNAEVAEHWIYLASIGILLLLAGAVLALPRQAQLAACSLAILGIGALGLRTAKRAGDWVNAETFCLRTIADGGATPRLLNTLAGLYGSRGDFAKQEAILRRMMERFPEYAPARIQLGICLTRQGRTAEAEPLLQTQRTEAAETARRYPRTWPAALNLARLHQDRHESSEALAILAEARRRFPETWELIRYESEIRESVESSAAALPAVEAFAAGHWWHLDAWTTLARLRYNAGQPEAAIAAFETASRLDIYLAAPLSDIARIELARGRGEVALARQLEAMRREPGQPSHYVLLSTIYEKLGRHAEAGQALEKAAALTAEARRSS
jgi:tetratricopeptide (TPR) repeat protein